MKHRKVSGKADGPDTTLVRPSDWNDFHVLEAFTLAGLPLAGNAGRLADVTNSIGGIHKDIGPRWIQQFGDIINVRERPFAAVGDDTTNDTAAIQAALNAVPSLGGIVYLPPGYTYLVSSANLTLKAKTVLWIPRGAILHLSTRRLTALNVNDVTVVLEGEITSTTLNTSDALPTNWDARGIAEFGGTAATPSERVGIIGPGRVRGDFAGTPGDVAIAFQDKRRGIVLTNVRTGYARGIQVSATIGEAIWYSGTAADRDIEIAHNSIDACNHDAISVESFSVRDVWIHHNRGRACATGIEAVDGVIEHNLMRDMVVGGGYVFGGNTPLNTVIYRNNVGFNNATTDFSLAGATAPDGALIAQGNLSINAGTSAYSFQFITDALIHGNIATGWGRTGAGSAYGIGGSLTRATVDANIAYGAGVNSIAGFNQAGNTRLTWGTNYAPGVANAYVGFGAAGQGMESSSLTMYSQRGSSALTGTVSETTLRSTTIKANSLGVSGGVKIIAAGTTAGTAGTKTIRLKWGGTTLATITVIAANTDNWRFEAEIYNVDANGATQNHSIVAYKAAAVDSHTISTSAVATTSDAVVLISGQLANTADTITLTTFLVQPILGIVP